ncbi:MAG: hypothetical protein U0X58_11365 [Flavobacteriaceae bacterium]|nr:hypothetical protein [Bacteroidota bacterium]
MNVIQLNSDFSVKTGTATGTLLSVMPNILSEDIVKTILLAIIGAASSFVVTLLLKWLTKSKRK